MVWAPRQELHRMGHRITSWTAPGSRCDFARVVALDPALPVERAASRRHGARAHSTPHYAVPIAKPHLVTVTATCARRATGRLRVVSRNYAHRLAAQALRVERPGLEAELTRSRPELARRGLPLPGQGGRGVSRTCGRHPPLGTAGRTPRRRLGGCTASTLEDGACGLTLTPRVALSRPECVDNSAKRG